NVSVAEIGGQDTWQRAVIGIAATGNDRRYVRGLLERALAFVEDTHLAEVVGSDIDLLEMCYEGAPSDDEAEEEGGVSRRLERVADQLRAEIARVLREEVSDPRARLVSVLRVDVSPDLRNAAVYWSRIETPDGAPLEAVAEGLASAAPFVRRELAHALALKRM